MYDIFYKNKISCLDLLSLISEEKYDVDLVDKLIKNYEIMFLGKNECFDEIFYSLRELCIRIKIELLTHKKEDERSLYPIFDKNISSLSDGCLSIINVKNNKKDIPDRWVKFKDLEIPVEFKKGVFNTTAKEQLRRYIDNYNSEFGIAIGRELSVELDDDMIFIHIDDMKKCKIVLSEDILENFIK